MSQTSESLSDTPAFSPPGTENNESEPEVAPARERKPRGRPSNDTQELERIEGMLRGSAMLVCGIASRVNQADAAVIYTHTLAPKLGENAVPPYTPNLIDATMQLAREDKKVRAYLAGLASQGAYLNVAVASGAIIMGIMSNHKLLPPMFNPSVETSPKAE